MVIRRKPESEGLFARPGAPEDIVTAHIDGGARGNPGPAGFGVVVRDAEGKVLAEISEFLGHRTNNVAEYSALLAALEFARDHGHPSLRVMSDSELLVKQMKGQYKVNSPDLRPLFEQARRLASGLKYFDIRHVFREQNRDADKLANLAMDRGMGRKPESNSAKSGGSDYIGVVVNGVVEFVNDAPPNGTRVKVRKID
jgi:ribonuclease HI